MMRLAAQQPAPVRARSQQGIAALETLLAAPIVLLLGMSVLQWALVFHGRGAVAHAAQEAARAGSVAHGSAQAIEAGLARGLSPWLHGAADLQEHQANLVRTRAHLAQGRAAGWLDWRRLAPTAESFTDWAQTARDADGEPIPGLLEIPNDNLSLRAGMRQPASGVAGYRGAEPIGAVSRQTLSDANLLKVEVVYGVPLTVPAIGGLAAWVMRRIDDCPGPAAGGGTSPDAGLRLGALDLGVPERLTTPRTWACAHYNARGTDGRIRPRWPVRVSATVRMQSPARDADAAVPLSHGVAVGSPSGTGLPSAATGQGGHGGFPSWRASLAPYPVGNGQGDGASGTEAAPSPSGVTADSVGTVDAPAAFRPIPVRQQNPGGSSAAQDGSADRAPGFLQLGGNRLLPPPATCGAV